VRRLISRNGTERSGPDIGCCARSADSRGHRPEKRRATRCATHGPLLCGVGSSSGAEPVTPAGNYGRVLARPQSAWSPFCNTVVADGWDRGYGSRWAQRPRSTRPRGSPGRGRGPLRARRLGTGAPVRRYVRATARGDACPRHRGSGHRGHATTAARSAHELPSTHHHDPLGAVAGLRCCCSTWIWRHPSCAASMFGQLAISAGLRGPRARSSQLQWWGRERRVSVLVLAQSCSGASQPRSGWPHAPRGWARLDLHQGRVEVDGD
jgi:hypothetical protein